MYFNVFCHDTRILELSSVEFYICIYDVCSNVEEILAETAVLKNRIIHNQQTDYRYSSF